MKVNLSFNKHYNGTIDKDKCVNCGSCSEYCSTGAVKEFIRWGETPCAAGCPFGIVPQTVALLIKRDRLDDARMYIKSKTNMSAPCSQLCQGMCIASCHRNLLDDRGIDMPALERYLNSVAGESKTLFSKIKSVDTEPVPPIAAGYPDRLLREDIVAMAPQVERPVPLDGEDERIEDIGPVLRSAGIDEAYDMVMAMRKEGLDEFPYELAEKVAQESAEKAGSEILQEADAPETDDAPEPDSSSIEDAESDAPEPEIVEPDETTPDDEAEVNAEASRDTGAFSNLEELGDLVDAESKVAAEPDAPKKVAIAGGGIAGITAAIALRGAGYEPTIFEKTDRLGGVYSNYATDRRIDKTLLEEGMNKVEQLGIDIVYNATVGLNPSLETLQKEFDSTLLAIGETKGLLPNLMGGLPKGVYDIVSIMDCIARGGEVKGVFGQGLVVGSDEMAIDAAMAMKRYCREVTILSPYSVGVMRILDAGVDIAIANGVNVISGIELCGINEMSGRLSAVDIRIKEKDYVMNIPCDTLVIGDCQVPDTDTIASRNKNLELDGRGYIKVDARMETTMAGIFALGDLEMSAADAGRAGAIAIDNHLAHVDQAVPMKFKGVKDYPSTYEIIEGRKDEDNPFAQRTGETQIYTKQQAEYEASRCIGCGYRQIDIDRCIGCGICEKQCLGDAIEMVRIPDSQGSEKEAE